MSSYVFPVHRLRDWSRVPTEIIELATHETNNHAESQNGLQLFHYYKGGLWTGPHVGVRKLSKSDAVVLIEPRFGLNPWEMLAEVFKDAEFARYLESSKRKSEPIYEIFSSEPPVRVPVENSDYAHILLCLSFISSCFSVCQKGLKKSIIKHEKNLSSKIRGKINIAKNLKNNTLRGRNDRFYCEFPTFTIDNVENRVLKSVLNRCSNLLADHSFISVEIKRMIKFCLLSLGNVQDVNITDREIGKLSATGVYSYYKTAFELATHILNRNFYTPRTEGEGLGQATCEVVPYLINMQVVFELYCRTKIKRVLPDGMVMDEYDKRLEVSNVGNKPSRLHLSKHLIPDITLRDRSTGEVIRVLDAKYKESSIPDRSDTLQLLAYSFNAAPKSSGFIFPVSSNNKKVNNFNISLKTPFVPGGIPYEEIFISPSFDWLKAIPSQESLGAPDIGKTNREVLLDESADPHISLFVEGE